MSLCHVVNMGENLRPAPIDKALYKALKHYCIDNERDLKGVLEQAIKDYLERNRQK